MMIQMICDDYKKLAILCKFKDVFIESLKIQNIDIE